MPHIDVNIERRFVDTTVGQFHFRCSRRTIAEEAIPIVMLHASPASSRALVSLIDGIGQHRQCYAPDTMGFGDSAPPPLDSPEVEDYAKWLMLAVDALGLDKFHIFGSHTGAHIAVEAALMQPARIQRVVLDGLAMFTADEKRDVLANYAPEIVPDDIGSQLNWAWHFVRDQALFFPYYHRDAAHRRVGPMFASDKLHDITVDVLKALQTYHLGYRAVFRHSERDRLPLVTHPTLVMADQNDPLRAGVEAAAALIADSTLWFSTDALEAKVAGIENFLNGGTPTP